jgi:molybdopterin molybdotransferase
MLTAPEALELALEAAVPLKRLIESESLQTQLWAANGRVLAEDALADHDEPRFDRSAMDGYACRSEDIAHCPASLSVIGEAPAGVPTDLCVGKGEAVTIMTGAEVPQGANTVVMVENTTPDHDKVSILSPAPLGKNIRRRGENMLEGAVAVAAGRVIDRLTIGVLASIGAASIATQRPPRVTVIGSGTELVDVTEIPSNGQIRDSNRHVLMALLRDLGATVVDGGRVGDDVREVSRAIRGGFESDVVVISGGVSVGTYDLVTNALDAEGVETIFHKVAMKPGKPLLLGRKGEKLIFGLPGNPVSTYVTAILFLLPVMRFLSGRKPGPWRAKAPLTAPLQATGRRETFHPARLIVSAGGALSCEPLPWLGSGDQIGFALADCFIQCQAQTPALSGGHMVDVILPHMPLR